MKTGYAQISLTDAQALTLYDVLKEELRRSLDHIDSASIEEVNEDIEHTTELLEIIDATALAIQEKREEDEK